MTLAQVFEALEKNNSNASGNFIEHESEQYVVRGMGLVKDMSDIENIIVAVRTHADLMRDLAGVKIGAELRQGAVTANGEGEVVAGIVLMLKGASGRDVVNAVKEKLPSIQKALPKGVELVAFYDRTDLVKKAIHTVTKALAEGAVFVLIILIVLLADVRSAIIVTLVLPLAALFAFIMMKWYGLSANLMSLGGLAIGIGMMVDGAVVMVENIHRHLTEPSDPARHQRPAKSKPSSMRRRKSAGRSCSASSSSSSCFSRSSLWKVSREKCSARWLLRFLSRSSDRSSFRSHSCRRSAPFFSSRNRSHMIHSTFVG